MSAKTEKSANEHVKVLIRRLPKFMSEEELLQQISPLPEEVIAYYFTPANLSFEKIAFASMILVFSSYCDALVEFERRFDGYIFVDSKGNDSQAVVEAAVNQSYEICNREKIMNEAKNGKIVNEPYYIEFVEKLEAEKMTPILSLEQQIKRLCQPDDIKTQIERMETPLVKHVLNKYIEKDKAGIERRMKIMGFSKTDLPPKSGNKSDNHFKTGDKNFSASNKFSDKKRERDAARLKKFLEEKKKSKEELPKNKLNVAIKSTF